MSTEGQKHEQTIWEKLAKAGVYMRNKSVMFMNYNISFAKRRSGLVYNFLWVIMIVLVYLNEVKMNDHLNETDYVKHDIETAEAAKQFTSVSKLIRGVEFDVNRNLAVTTIRVIPHPSFDEVRNSLTEVDMGKHLAFEENDTTLYFFDERWKRMLIPVSRTPKDETFTRFLYVTTDRTAGRVVLNGTELAFIDYEELSVDRMIYDSALLHKITGPNGSNPIYYQGYYLSTITKGNDSILSIPISRAVRGDIPEPSPNAEVIRVPLPPGVVDYKSFKKGLIIHSMVRGLHSFSYLGEVFDVDVQDNFDALVDSVVNKYHKETQIYWQTDGHTMLVADNGGGITLMDFSAPRFRHYQNKLGLTFSNSGNNRSSVGMVVVGGGVVWIGGTSPEGLRLAKVSFGEKADSLVLYQVPNFSTTEVNNRQMGLTGEGVVLWDKRDDDGGDFYLLSDSKSAPVKFEMFEPWIKLNLAAYDLSIPAYSSRPQIIAAAKKDPDATFVITRGKEITDTDIANVKDTGDKGARLVKWPTRDPFEVKTSMDYFFAVILIIGGIIVYFFGLFYVMDFNNKDIHYNPEDDSKWDKLKTLKEKVSYARNSMRSLKLRSEIMLWIGLVIGVAGMFAFVLSLKTIFETPQAFSGFTPDFLVRLLRTFGIFSFMEIFSFYFLKQYRIIFNEYKRFFSLYMRLMNYYQYIEVTEKYGANETELAKFDKMRDNIMVDVVNMHEESNMEKIVEFEKSVAQEVTKTLASKIPDA